MMPQHKVVADVGMGVAFGAPAWAWITHANELAQLIAAVVAIISGLSATWYYVVRALAIRRMHNRPESSDTVTKD